MLSVHAGGFREEAEMMRLGVLGIISSKPRRKPTAFLLVNSYVSDRDTFVEQLCSNSIEMRRTVRKPLGRAMITVTAVQHVGLVLQPAGKVCSCSTFLLS